MSFLSRPSWYGKPVLIRESTRSFLRAIGLIFGAAFVLSVVLSVVLAFAPQGKSREGIVTPIQVFFGASSIFSLAIGWFVGMFFFFRAFINAIRIQFHTAEGFKRWSLKAFYTPFFGFREQDLSAEGIRYRSLAVEGFIGFVIVNLSIWILIFASKLVGLDFDL